MASLFYICRERERERLTYIFTYIHIYMYIYTVHTMYIYTFIYIEYICIRICVYMAPSQKDSGPLAIWRQSQMKNLRSFLYKASATLSNASTVCETYVVWKLDPFVFRFRVNRYSGIKSIFNRFVCLFQVRIRWRWGLCSTYVERERERATDIHIHMYTHIRILSKDLWSNSCLAKCNALCYDLEPKPDE